MGCSVEVIMKKEWQTFKFYAVQEIIISY